MIQKNHHNVSVCEFKIICNLVKGQLSITEKMHFLVTSILWKKTSLTLSYFIDTILMGAQGFSSAKTQQRYHLINFSFLPLSNYFYLKNNENKEFCITLDSQKITCNSK